MAGDRVRDWINKQAHDGRVAFTLGEVRRECPTMSQNAVRSALYRTVKRRETVVVWQRFYLILPPEYRREGMLPPCEYIDELMGYLRKPYCVALLNAAEIYGAVRQHPMEFVVMTNDPPPRSARRGDVRIDFVGKRALNQGIPPELVRRIKTQYSVMNVATPEFTALTLLQYEHVVGGFSDAFAVVPELLDACRFDAMPQCITTYVPTVCFQRLGYLMDRVLHETAAADLLRRTVDAAGLEFRKTCLQRGRIDRTCPYDDKWRLYINTSLQNHIHPK